MPQIKTDVRINTCLHFINAMKNLSHLKNSLALRLLKVVFSIYLCITVIVTLVQMAGEYALEERFAKDSLVINQAIFQESLTKSAWDFNFNQLSSIADGIMKQPTIAGIEIATEDGYLIQKGHSLNQKKSSCFRKG